MTWLQLHRDVLAGAALLAVYWLTLVLAHYYFETSATRQRVLASIGIARHCAGLGIAAGPAPDAGPPGNGNGGGRWSTSSRAAVLTRPAPALVAVRAADHGRAVIAGLLDSAEQGLAARRRGAAGSCQLLMTFLGWESAPELAAIQVLHAASVETYRGLADDEAVAARLLRARGELEELTVGQSQLWRTELAAPPAQTEQERRSQRARLCAFLEDLYECRQVRNARLASLQQRAAWGVLITLWALLALVAGGDGRVLLAGALGGLLSRLTRFTGIRWVTTDFGLGWAQLYLAPPVGALAAWAGIHVLLMLQGTGSVHLGAQLVSAARAQGTGPGASAVLGLAFVLGFSERLFDRLLRRAADTIVAPSDPEHPVGTSITARGS